MTRELNVDPTTLAIAAQGINDTIGELNDVGALGVGEVGRGFSSLQLTGMEAGAPDLASAFADFCARWGWGLRALVQDANRLARSLDLSAGIYHHEDAFIDEAFKVLGASAFADPRLAGQQRPGR